jgi:hypothetical protein
MDVTFTLIDDKRYGIAISREHGPDIPLMQAPGYDDWMPHDLAHYLVEEHFGIRLGIFGQTAAGGGSFAPDPAERSGRSARTAKRLDSIAHAGVGESEALVGICVAAWRRRAYGEPLPPWVSEADTEREGVAACVDRLDELAHRWHALQPGRSLTLTWPRRLTVDPGRMRAGRRTQKNATQRRGRGH